MKFTNSCFVNVLIASLVSLVASVPIERRDVFVPRILSPQQGDVWVIGQSRTVAWDISNAPAQITNTKGRIMLRKGQLIMLNETLADGFDIRTGHTTIVVPNVTPANDYSIVLFGDSGNWSGLFSIQSTAPGSTPVSCTCGAPSVSNPPSTDVTASPSGAQSTPTSAPPAQPTLTNTASAGPANSAQSQPSEMASASQ